MSERADAERKKEMLSFRISSHLNAEMSRSVGAGSRSSWIEEAIRERLSREKALAPDLPAAARNRIAQYAALVQDELRDVELEKLEAAWKREEDPHYYGLRSSVPSTLDACVDAMIGRGSARRIPAARGCM